MQSSRYNKIYMEKLSHKITPDYNPSLQRCTVHPITDSSLKHCASLINSGKLVSFPTETVYGLGADCTNPDAIKSIYTAKGRPLTDPVIVHISSMDMCDPIIDSNESDIELFDYLGKNLWPGPITLIVKANLDYIPLIVTAGTGYVGIRFPMNEIAQKLITLAGTPICAPSANKFAHISPTSSVHVFNDLYDKELAILDGDDTTFGIESTVVKLVKDESGKRSVYILRHGSVPTNKIRSLIKEDERFTEVEVIEKEVEKCDGVTKQMEAPGQLLKHYCPKLSTYLLEDLEIDSGKELDLDLKDLALIDFGGVLKKFSSEAKSYQDLSPDGDVEEAMKHLYAFLRDAEMVEGATHIFMVGREKLQKQIRRGREFFPALYDKMFRSASGIVMRLSLEEAKPKFFS